MLSPDGQLSVLAKRLDHFLQRKHGFGQDAVRGEVAFNHCDRVTTALNAQVLEQKCMGSAVRVVAKLLAALLSGSGGSLGSGADCAAHPIGQNTHTATSPPTSTTVDGDLRKLPIVEFAVPRTRVSTSHSRAESNDQSVRATPAGRRYRVL
jgi:hypothetical protein